MQFVPEDREEKRDDETGYFRQRWFEIAVIVITGSAALLYWLGLLALPLLYSAVALGLMPLATTAVHDLVRERKIGTELFISIATVIAMVGGEYVAGAVMLSIILIAELIADLNSERARASIKSLIGAIPQTALVRRDGREASIAIDDVKVGEIVIVRAGERIPVDGTVASGKASVNQAPITGESVPVEKRTDDQVFAGTVVDLGALDVRVDKRGKETLYSRIIALVENAQASQAPVQKLTDRVAAWLIPVVLVFLVAVFAVTRDLKLIITLMIFTSPAELGLATPLVIIAAVARAAQSGILLKGGVVWSSSQRLTSWLSTRPVRLHLGAPRWFGSSASLRTLKKTSCSISEQAWNVVPVIRWQRRSSIDQRSAGFRSANRRTLK